MTLVRQRRQRFIRGCGYIDENQLTVGVPVRAVKHQAVQVDVGVRGRSRHSQARLDQRDRAAVGLLGLESGLIEQETGDGTVHDLQHLRHQLRLCGQQ